MSEQIVPKPHLAEQNVELSSPEERESFEGQKVLVIGGPDAHGVSMAVTSAQYLEKRGAEATINIGSPVIREGKGATHPGAFYSKTLPALNLEGYDRAIITDIPLDFKHLEQSEEELIKLTERLNAERQRRNLPPLEHPVFFLDHHSTTKFQKDTSSIAIKTVSTAQECRLGSEQSQAARIGAICDRDAATLPVTEEEMVLAKGLDAAVRPDPGDAKPVLSKNATEEDTQVHQQALIGWEERAQARLMQAAERLKAGDWDYFKQEAERLSRVEVPTASGFGEIAIVDTQDLTGKFAVLKLMEMAIENNGVDATPYALGVLRDVRDEKMGREQADIVSVIRHWTREDLPSVEDVLVERFGEEFIERYRVYGAENAKTIRLPVNDHETARIAASIVEAFAGREMPDFSKVRSVVMCGDPNSGKSVFSTIFRESLKNLGVKVSHLDLDKAAPTPTWYLDAEVGYKEAEFQFAQGKIPQEKLDEAKRALEEAAEKRRGMKRPWSIELAEEAKQEILWEAQQEGVDFVIGDIGGGRIKKDENGKTVKITRLTAENARILEGTDAVLIVSNNPEGAAEWKRLIEMGVDPETGVRIERDTPIEIIGMYQSILEGTTQKVAGNGNENGVITNLDRSKAERKYNPAIFTTAMFVSEAVDRRILHEQAEQVRNPYQQELRQVADEYTRKLLERLPEGTVVDLGGSLLSNTALRGHNDIDLRILLPAEWTSEEKIREVSQAIADLVPFQKDRPVGSPENQQFAVMHQLNFEQEGIEGEAELEISVRPAEGYVGFAKFQSSLPQELLDRYVVLKDATKERKQEYKKVKEQFYAMTRWLHARGYWDEQGEIAGTQPDLEQAEKLFWGDNLDEVLTRSTPEI